MEKKTKIILIVLAILLIAAIGVTAFMSPSTMSKGNTTITDMANRTVTVPTSVNTVVATSPPMTTIVYMLAPEKLGGLNFQWTNEELQYVPDQYKDLPNIGGWYGSNDGSYEQFIAANPDVVIESLSEGSADNSTKQDRQEKFGTIPVVGVTDNTDVTKIDSSIKFVGKLVGAEDKANSLCAFNDKYLQIVNKTNSTIPNNERKTVYYAEGEDGLSTDPNGTAHAQLISLCGGYNVADVQNQSGEGQVQVSIEQVVGWNPDVIIANDPDFYNKVYNDSTWSNINAVKNHQVYLSPQSPFKWIDRPPGANIIIGVPWVAKVLYPDQYSDIHLKDATKEFYSDYYHIDLNDQQVTDLLKSSGLNESQMS